MDVFIEGNAMAPLGKHFHGYFWVDLVTTDFELFETVPLIALSLHMLCCELNIMERYYS